MSTKEERTLKKYIELKEKWTERFSGDDENSICRQLHDLTWYLTVFHVVNESRGFSQNAEGQYENNSMLHNFIDKCFFEYMFVALRRLLDKDREKTTCSLYRLILDMENSRHLISIYFFLKAYDFEYYLKKIKKEYEKYCEDQRTKGNRTFEVPNSLIWQELEHRHSAFDKLSGVNKSNRKPNDVVQKVVFEGLRKKLEGYGDVVLYAHKFIAHLETPLDREKDSADKIDLTLGRLCETHEALCKIATFIGRFLDFPGPFLGTVVFNQFENIDKPFVKTENIDKLHEIWKKYSTVIDFWAYVDIHNYDTML